ncbi:hypothetical protein EDB85DRAFT_2143083 [Lactarius pseudohatsudake]|nr:hypothetical protein EDB85DRAFT_2143083 [Lactarius pseudohatsudake]
MPSKSSSSRINRSAPKEKKRHAESTDSKDRDEGNDSEQTPPSPQKSQRKKKKTRKAESAGEEGVRQLKRKGKGKQKEVVVDEDEGAETEPKVVNNSEEDGDEVEDLDAYQGQGIPEIVIAKKDSTRDLLTVFSDKIKVIFKKLIGVTEILEG